MRKQAYNKLLILLHFMCKAETRTVVRWEEIFVLMTRSLTLNRCKHFVEPRQPNLNCHCSRLLVCTTTFNVQPLLPSVPQRIKLQLENTTEIIVVYVVIILIHESCDIEPRRHLLRFSTAS